MKIILIIVAVVVLIIIAINLFINLHPVFGGKPVGLELDRIIQSPNYQDSVFNQMWFNSPTLWVGNKYVCRANSI